MPQKEHEHTEYGEPSPTEDAEIDLKGEKKSFRERFRACLLEENDALRSNVIFELLHGENKTKLPVGEINDALVEILSEELGRGTMPEKIYGVIGALKDADFVVYDPIITEIAERAVEYANQNGEGQRAKDIREYFRLPEGNDW